MKEKRREKTNIIEENKNVTEGENKIVKIRIDNYADLEDITGKLAKAGLWVKTEEVEDWPHGKYRLLCIKVDNDICELV